MVSMLSLMPRAFLGLRRDLLLQERVGGGNEVIPAQPVNRCALRVGGSTRRGEYRGDATDLRRDRTGAGELKSFRRWVRAICFLPVGLIGVLTFLAGGETSSTFQPPRVERETQSARGRPSYRRVNAPNAPPTKLIS